MMRDIKYFRNRIDNLGLSQMADINRLLKQLSPKSREITLSELKEGMHKSVVFLAIDMRTSGVVGMVTLTRAWKPTASFGSMEDLVVDEAYAGHGIGTELIKLLRAEAMAANLEYVNFTSSRDRVKANRLYLALGAEQREANVYRFKVE